MEYVYSDGGRNQAGYTGAAGDCVVRAIAIATDLEYQVVYDALTAETRRYASNRRNKIAQKIQSLGASPRRGVYKEVYTDYLKNLGWEKRKGGVKLDDDTFRQGTFLCKTRKHLCCIKDGVLFDSYDSQLTTGKYAPATIKTVFTYWTQPKEELL